MRAWKVIRALPQVNICVPNVNNRVMASKCSKQSHLAYCRYPCHDSSNRSPTLWPLLSHLPSMLSNTAVYPAQRIFWIIIGYLHVNGNFNLLFKIVENGFNIMICWSTSAQNMLCLWGFCYSSFCWTWSLNILCFQYSAIRNILDLYNAFEIQKLS